MKKFFYVLLVFIFSLSFILNASAGYEEGILVENADVAFEAKKATAPQAFDGIVSMGEYYKVDLNADMMSYTWNDAGDDGTIARSLNFEYYIAWDDNNVRVAVVYKSGNPYFNNYKMGENEGSMWDRTAIQLGFANLSGDPADFLEIGLARNSIEGGLLNKTWRQAISGKEFEPKANKDYTVVLVGNGDLVYEVAVPWINFAPDVMRVGDTFGTNLVVAGGTDDTGYVHAQVSAGVTGPPGKNATLFAKVTLVEGPVETGSGTTNIIIIGAIIVCILAAGAFVYYKKKTTAK